MSPIGHLLSIVRDEDLDVNGEVPSVVTGGMLKDLGLWSSSRCPADLGKGPNRAQRRHSTKMPGCAISEALLSVGCRLLLTFCPVGAWCLGGVGEG